MRDFTVIVPTWNMGRYLEPLFDSIVNSDFANSVEEVLFLCDKSDDGSEEIIARLASRQEGRFPKVRLLQPPQRRGLFVARYLAAKAAVTPKIMFIDSRITLSAATGKALAHLTKKYAAMSCNVDIDVTKNIFCLYWQRSHETLFRSTYVANQKGVTTVDEHNFNTHRIGGTCFYCSRDPFVRISEQYMDQPLFSDDTYVFADLVKIEPFTVHPDFRINWEPRDTALVFLKHLYGRGPGFAQYNFYRRRGALFYATVLGVIFLLSVVALLFVKPLLGLGLLLGGLLSLMLTTLFIARSAGEFLRLAPLHTAVIIYYGLGALRGAWVVYKRSGFHAPTAKLS